MKGKDLGLILSLAILIYLAVGSEKMILVAEGWAVSPEVIETGRAVYAVHCHDCHGRGREGAPRIGDEKEWERRIEKGADQLIVHATEEHRRLEFLPAPGRPNPDNDEIASAVAYLVNERDRKNRPPPAPTSRLRPGD